MRLLSTAIFALSLGLSSQALAGTHSAGSGYAVSQENGVTVYRGQHPEANFKAVAGAQAAHDRREQISALKTKVRQKQAALRKEQERSAELESRVERLEAQSHRHKRRGRYGRSYFGNNRFFGPNGFAGNRHFSGANPIPVRRTRPTDRARRPHH